MTTVNHLADALRGLLADPYLSDPINNDRMGPARAALAAHDAAPVTILPADAAADLRALVLSLKSRITDDNCMSQQAVMVRRAAESLGV